MADIPFHNLAGIALVAFVCPLLLGLVPALRIPSAALEIVAGIIIGPAVLGWVQPDIAINVMYIAGLGFLLYLSGMEIDFRRLRGATLRYSLVGFVFSFLLAFAVAYLLQAIGVIKELPETPLLVAIVLSATSLGLVVPVLKDSGHHGTPFGQLVIASSTVAEVAPIVLLSLFFSARSSDNANKFVLLGFLAVLGVIAILGIQRAERVEPLNTVMSRLQDTTAQIRVRGAFALLVFFIAVVDRFGIEDILGAFTAGAALKVGDRSGTMTEPTMRIRLEAIGFGVFIPIFFVTSGLTFKLGTLFTPAALLKVPVFLAAILLARGVPAMLYRSVAGFRRALAAGFLQSTTLSFVVVATQLGLHLNFIRHSTASALVAAALLSVLLFPLIALVLLKTEDAVAEEVQRETAAVLPS